jgi:hypothetical protein
MSNEIEQIKKEIQDIAQALKRLKFCVDELENRQAPAQVAGATEDEIKVELMPLSDKPAAAGQKFVDKIEASKPKPSESQLIKDLLGGYK